MKNTNTVRNTNGIKLIRFEQIKQLNNQHLTASKFGIAVRKLLPK